jgi:penicillin-binding protein 1C
VLAGERGDASREAPFGPGAAWLTLQALADVTRPDSEGAWRSFASARHLAWKTGTSYGLRDAWAVGTTPGYTVGVWAGNATGEGVAGLSGLQSAAPILFDAIGALPASQDFDVPHHDLKTVEVCRRDGYLANDLCEAVRRQVPRRSHFARASPHHVRVHLDRSQAYRVDSRCARVSEMVARSWFVLPPREAHFYRTHHADYRPLPPQHPDCARLAATQGGPMALLYPGPDTAIYIPTDLDGRPSRALFEAVHREPDATLHWHLNERYIASTRDHHQLALLARPGSHQLLLVDQMGNTLEQSFEVMGTSERDPFE